MQPYQFPHFETATAYCYLLPEGIFLAKNKLRADQEFRIQNDKPMMVLIYLLLLMFVLYQIWQRISEHKESNTHFIFLPLGMIAIANLIDLFQYSRVNMMHKETIREIHYKKGIPVIGRAHFMVVFEKKGKIKKRLIVLPFTWRGGEAKAQAALLLLEAAGYKIIN